MNFFGLSSPFAMASQTEDSFSSSSIKTDSSTSSTFSYTTTPSQPIASTSSYACPNPILSPAKRLASADHKSSSAPLPPSHDLPPPAPVAPPPNSYASAQAAMAAQNSSHSQNLIGHRIDSGRLEFVSILGLGAYGVVYLARDIIATPSSLPNSRAHPSLGHQPLYAVKCLNKVGLDARQRSFQSREILLHGLASSHGNVVTLYNVIEEAACIYVVMEFCEEGDLFGMITDRQRYLGNDELIRSVFLQIIESVEYCHARGIFHRDLKPENILCLEDGKKVVLADFGLATSDKSSGDFGCGSTFYMSPECQGGLFQRLSSYSTPQNDVWSLGVILVNLTCGRNPWKQACPSDETFRAYLANPDFLRSILPISEHTNAIFKRIFSLNPQTRISLQELRQEILAVRTFVMTEEELKHATKATKEAASAFANGHEERPLAGMMEEMDEEMDEKMDEKLDEEMDVEDEEGRGMTEEDVRYRSPPPSRPHTFEDTLGSATPTQTSHDRAARPLLTPPCTPRRAANRPPALAPSKPLLLPAAFSDDDSAGTMSPSGSEGSSSNIASDDSARHELHHPYPRDPFVTPSQSHVRNIFHNANNLEVDLPPSPVTPSPPHALRRPRKNVSTRSARSRSPKASCSAGGETFNAGTKGCQPPRSVDRRRQGSIDSSSSSSGNSSQPPTPTGGPPSYATRSTDSHHRHSKLSGSALQYARATQVRIVSTSPNGNSTFLADRDDTAMQIQAGSGASAEGKEQLMGYYPVFADWEEAVLDQQSHYGVREV